METFISKLSGKQFPISEKISTKTIRHPVLKLIQKENPAVTHDSLIAESELNYYRGIYITEYLTHEIGELTEPEKTVLQSLTQNTTLTNRLDGDEQQKISFGQMVSDKVASFGGSWTFIISFFIFMIIWILLNTIWFANTEFDPYPFILLNLILSCIASIQAPVIMMSQNRQEEKDRERARKDYMINLKSELEIRTIQEKLDHFIMDQQPELIELQKKQFEVLNEMMSKMNNKER